MKNPRARSTRRKTLAALLVTATAATTGLAAGPVLQAGAIPVSPTPGTVLNLTAVPQAVWSAPATLTASIPRLAGKGYPTGSVTFSEGDAALGVVKLSGGKAVFKPKTLELGSHEITADYPGDVQYGAANAGPVSVEIVKAGTTTTVKSTKLVVAKGTAASFQATSKHVAPAAGVISGSTRFTATAPGLSPVTVTLPLNASGTAQWRTHLAEGNYTVTAQYLGNDQWIGSSSGSILQKVGNPKDVVANKPPTAVASVTPGAGLAPLPVAFSSAGSIDTDGTIVGYSWDFGDGTSSTDADPTHTYDQAGTYLATLTVTDDGGATDKASASVVVTAPNQKPVAAIDASTDWGKGPLAVDFSSDASSDPDGKIVGYHWDFDDGATSDEANPSHTFATRDADAYLVTLTVTDDQGASDVASTWIWSNANQAPSVSIYASPEGDGQTFDFYANAWDDGEVVAYAWDFGDGDQDTSSNPFHTYFSPGTYTVTLTVTDDDGVTNTDKTTVTVADTTPHASVIASTVSARPGERIDFDAGGSTAAPGRSIVRYDWDYDDGSSELNAASRTSHTFSHQGVYLVEVRVQDDLGQIDTALVLVVVQDGP